MKKRYYTDFEFYYDENTMDIPQNILESKELSDAAKNIYIYFIYLITENVDDVLDAMSGIDEAKKDLEVGLEELLACGLIKNEIKVNEAGEEELHYIVTKEMNKWD